MPLPDESDPLSAPSNADWRPHARRIAPLINGIDYYRAVRSALIAARSQVFIIGWELHSEIDLLRGEEAERSRNKDGWPVRLADLLQRLVCEREMLEVRLLIWEGASLFALERQHLPRMKRPWGDHPRISLVWDRDTPKLGSQHQKIVVVDDRVAFAGGMDLTKSRWDDHRHLRRDRRRRNPGLIPSYGDPYHDAMIVVDGDAARTLGEWSRERWRRATGEPLDAPELASDRQDDPWPSGVDPLLRDRRVEIALTQPDFGDRPEIRQVEIAFLEQIRSARQLIFIETQYLASEPITEALCERLRDPDGPEIVLILPYGCPGRLQAMAMDTRRDDLLDRLRDADLGGRLGVYWATLEGGDEEDVFEKSVYIHAKVLIIDDRILRIGSANLNNRSMGLDTELDVTVRVEDSDQDAIRRITSFRRSLLAHLLDADAERIEEHEQSSESVLRAIERLRGGDRTLQPFDHRTPEPIRNTAINTELADPPRPLDPMDAQRVLDEIEAHTGLITRSRKAINIAIGVARRHIALLAAVVAILLIAALWRATPLHEVADRAHVERAFDWLESSPVGVAGVIATFIALASVGFPVTVLIAVIGATYALWWSIPICLLGIAVSSLIGFFLGRLASRRNDPDRSAGRIRSALATLGEHGVLSVAVLRNLPVAPFAAINFVCGMTGLRWPAYLAGTLIGMLPGIILIGVMGRQIGDLLRDPSPSEVAGVVVIALILVGAAIASEALRRRLLRRNRDDDSG